MAGTESMRIKLTTASVAKHLVAPDDPRRPTMIYGTELSGFGASRTSVRPGSYFIHYRVNRQQRKKAIGQVYEINVADARDEATRIKLAARQGTDLLAERKLEADHAKTLGEAHTRGRFGRTNTITSAPTRTSKTSASGGISNYQ